MIKKIIKYFFLAMLALVIGALIVRIAIASDKSTFDDFEVTNESKTVYAESGSLNVKTLKLKDRIGNAGYFCAYSMYYVEETSELQVAVRYNVSAIDYAEVESDADFEFLLMKRDTPIDLKNENSSHDDLNQGNLFVRYDGEYMRPSTVEDASKYKLYRFKKLIFKNIPVEEDGFEAGEYVIVMVPVGMELPTPDADALVRNAAYEMIFDSQEIHFAAQPTDKYKLSRKNLAAMSEN